jgi:hypothetical protein
MLIEDAKPLERLFFIIDGPVILEKNGSRFEIEDRGFFGEVSFLQKGLTTARVDVGEGACYVEWPVEYVRRLMRRSPALDNAIMAQFYTDMAGKIARSLPKT